MMKAGKGVQKKRAVAKSPASVRQSPRVKKQFDPTAAFDGTAYARLPFAGEAQRAASPKAAPGGAASTSRAAAGLAAPLQDLSYLTSRLDLSYVTSMYSSIVGSIAALMKPSSSSKAPKKAAKSKKALRKAKAANRYGCALGVPRSLSCGQRKHASCPQPACQQPGHLR
jgi:hypothetical protein